jgi:hypothetical protein
MLLSLRKYLTSLRKNRNLARDAVRIAYEFLKTLWTSLRIKKLDVDIEYGAGDPARTGRIFGVVKAAEHMLAPRNVRIDLHPVWDGTRVNGRAALEISVHPLTIVKGVLKAAISALFSPSLRSFIFGKIWGLIFGRGVKTRDREI